MQREKFRQMCKQTLVRVNIEILWLWKGYSDVEGGGEGVMKGGIANPSTKRLRRQKEKRK